MTVSYRLTVFLSFFSSAKQLKEKESWGKLSNLGIDKWHFQVEASLSVFVLFSSGFALCMGLHGMKKDLHCNPLKLVVSGNKLFVPGGRKWDSLRDGVSKGWRGISRCVLLRKDMILSSPSLGRLSWQPKKARAYPTEPTTQLQESLYPCVLEEMNSD